MKKASLIIQVFILLFFTVSCNKTGNKASDPSSAKFSEERLGRIDNMIQQYVDSGWIAGAVGYISRDGKVVYEKAFGVSDLDTKTVMEKDAIFRIASQTKAITSVAVMMLFEEGKFLLDDPVSKYIPEFANPVVLDKFNPADSSYTTIPANREITIRDLLTHTSGIDYAGIGSRNMRAIYAKAGIPTGFVSEKILLGDKMRLLGRMPLVHQPGEKFTYGLNCDVLGYLVEVLSHQTLSEFFHSRIFEPLEMNDTYFYLPESKRSRLVKVAGEDSNHKLINTDGTTEGALIGYPLVDGTYYSGGAGLSSTIEDYAKFHTYFYLPESKRSRLVKVAGEDSNHKLINTDGTTEGALIGYPLVDGTYYSGGAGLSSTIEDYAKFLQMMLDKGVYKGKRLLSRRTVELMTCNQIGDLNVGRDKFGLGFEITTVTGQAQLGITEGSFAWGGYFGTTYWADPKEHIVALLFTQHSPFRHGEIQNKFKAMVYQGLDD
jgi:CubicO group peptidase (beta-lactamase class C family)